MDTPSRIVFTLTCQREIPSTGADLTVRIRGQSFFTGSEVFKKAEEVRRAVAALVEAGLDEQGISLESVSAEVATGLLGKSSSAAYVLRVRCGAVELLGPALAVISSQKNAELLAIRWRCDGAEKIVDELLTEAVLAAKQRARQIAAALDVPLVGVHKLEHQIRDSAAEAPRLAPLARGRALHAVQGDSGGDALEGLNLTHLRRVAVLVSAEFTVGGYA